MRRSRTSILVAFSAASAFILAASSATAQKAVFAHYMVTNEDYQGDDASGEQKIAAYEKEIQQAQAIGIDGFALNVGGWTNQDYYVRYSSEMFEAAYRLNSGFKLMFSADMCCGNGVADVEDMMRRFVNNSHYQTVYYQRNGKYVLSTFAGESQGTGFWQQVKNDLTNGANASTYNNTTALSSVTGVASSAAMPVFLLPAFFWGGETPATSAIQSGFTPYQNIIDGSFYWGLAGVPGLGSTPDQIPSSEGYASVLHNAGKQYMAPICFQFWGANANRYYEYSGYSGMRKMWLDAINVSHPDLVEIITWNDFIEGSYVSPIDDPNKYPNANYLNGTGVPTSTLGYFHSHHGVTDFLKYYIQWYKTGTQPAISSDAVYWAYRTQSKATTAANNTPNVGTLYGPVADNVYVSANLTAPAQLKVNAGAGTQTLSLQAGYNEVAVPFVATNQQPTFELDRNNSSVLTGTGTDAIQTAPQYNDFYNSTGDMSGATTNTAPGTPTNLAAVAGAGKITLSWAASTGSTPITYSVLRSTTSGGETTPAIASNLTATTYSDTGITSGTTYFYKVSAQNGVGSSGLSTEASTKTVASVHQINAGGGAIAPFSADTGSNGGTPFSSNAAIDLSSAANPAPAAVYQTCRWGTSFAYTLSGLTPNAAYTVRLHFAELTFTSSGARKFNVAINGGAVLTSFDVFAAAGGQNKALTRQFPATANGSGQIIVSFTNGGPDNPMVNGIEVLH